jgi:diguanylate cyclase (GGDEF)-like protein/PAS domain S-box-containing protein
LTHITSFLNQLDNAGFAAIGLLAILDWARHRGRVRAWLAAALGMLGLVFAFGLVRDLKPLPNLIPIASLVCFMGSGYALVEFRHQLIPLRRHVRPVLFLLLAATTAFALPLTATPTMSHPSGFALAVVTALILEWAVCVAEPALRFLLASRGLPVVQRMRLRTLAVGCLAIAIALVLALGADISTATVSTQPSPLVGLAFQLVATAVIPLLYVGFAPPTWLRRSWRGREADTYRRGNEALLAFTADEQTLASHTVDWAIRFVGAAAGLMLAADEEVLASRNLSAAEIVALAERARRDVGDSVVVSENAIFVPMPTAEGTTVLAIVAGRFTPIFGREERRLLADYANSLAIAMDRVHLAGFLRSETERMESLLQSVSELGAGIVTIEDGQIRDANEAFVAMTRFRLDELRGQRLVHMAPEEHRERFAEGIDLHGSAPSRYEGRLIRSDGVPIDVEAVFHRRANGGTSKLVALVQDISARKRAERALADSARLDPVAAVPNRRAWQEQLDASLEHAATEGRPVCVAMLDLDDFKEFNDDWGHQRGDQLLLDLARTWRGALREGDFLARIGGDEFAAIMPGCSLIGAEHVLERVINASPHEVSIGLAEWDRNETAAALMARADGALLRSKRDRRGAITTAEERLGNDRYVNWSARLEEVLARRHLTSAYQPIVALDTNRVLGYEALLRLAGSPAESSVDELFTSAQRLGHSRALDWLGRRTALECSAGLPADSLLFVNVSARTLLDPVHGSDQMLMLLRWVHRRPEQTVLEISEREVISSRGRFSEVLAEYRSAGFRFALDDVGEGHSTLEVLAAADAEYIKIARSLTEGVHRPGPRSAVLALLRFAETSGGGVIAEGISDASLGEWMSELGVRFGQGYALGRPQYFPARTDVAPVLPTSGGAALVKE